ADEHATARAEAALKLRALFDSIDVDNSGVIERGELLSRVHGKQQPRESMFRTFDKLWQRMDKDGSGSVAFHEFVAGILEESDAVDWDANGGMLQIRLGEFQSRGVLLNLGFENSEINELMMM